MRISDISINHPLFITMVNLLVVVLGLISFQSLGIDQSPDVDLPYVSLSVEYPGANPRTVEEQLLKPIEKELRSIQGLKQMTGTARSNGISINMEFQLNVKSEQAFIDVKDKVAQISLPTGAKSLNIYKASTSDRPVLTLAVSSEKVTPTEMMRFVNETLKPKIQQIQGVGTIYVSGYREPELHIKLDQYKINSVNLTPLSIAEQISNQVVTLSTGSLNQKSRVTPITTYNIPNSIPQVKNLPINTNQGDILRLGDLAQIEVGLSKQTSYGEFNGNPLIMLYINKQSGGNLVQVAKDINAKIGEIKKTLPANIHLQIVDEYYSFIQNSLTAVGEDIILGALLAVLIVFLFLHDFRSTFISAVAIPASLIGTFVMMNLLDFTLNWMTLLALTICIGILVDDAIVVIENIHRHFNKMGKNSITAARDGTGEIGLAALSVTLTIVAVFIPVAFMQGLVGRFFLQFGLTVTVAVLLSLFVAFTMVPMLSSKMLVQEKTVKHKFFLAFDRLFAKSQKGYSEVLKKCLKFRMTVVLMAVGIFIGSALLLKFVPVSMEPAFNTNKARINVELEDGITLVKSIKRGREMEEFIRAYPGVENVSMRIGGDSGINNISYKIQLIDEKKRNFTDNEFAARISQELKKFLPGENEKINFGGNYKPLQIALFSDNDEQLKQYAKKLADYMNTLKDVQNATSNSSPSFEYRIIPDPVKSAIAKVSPTDVANTVKFLFSDDSYVGKYNDNGNIENMRLMISNTDAQNLNNLLGIYIQRTNDNPVLLSSIASINKVPIEQEITHIDGLKQLSVQADYVGKDLSGTTHKIYDYVAKTHPLDITYKLLGDSNELQETLRQVSVSLSLAALFVFMVLCSQFGNFRAPIAIMVSIPLCFSGAFLALLTTGQPLTLYSMIGIVLLMGLVVKNAILLVEFAQQKIKAGYSSYDALMDSSKNRLRPIIMTTLTMIVGMLPMVLGAGDGHEARTNMAITVVGGLISSTLLTLIVVPCVYSLLVTARTHRSRRTL